MKIGLYYDLKNRYIPLQLGPFTFDLWIYNLFYFHSKCFVCIFILGLSLVISNTIMIYFITLITWCHLGNQIEVLQYHILWQYTWFITLHVKTVSHFIIFPIILLMRFWTSNVVP
jgi:hypothetical protein